MGTRSNFVGKKKGVGVGLDLRMQEENKDSGHERLMVFPDNNNNYYYYNRHYDESQLSSSSSASWENTSGSGGDCGGGGGVGGSMFCNTSNQVACMGDIYDVVGAASGSGSVSGTTNSALLMSKSLNSCNTTDSSSLFHFNSSVGDQMAAAAASVNFNVRVPFTAAQLQELERQTMIYKYMLASVPVPHELILPISKTPSRVPPSQSNSSMELGLLSNNNSDPEPWRCRRTDGKKWRCSRDVAPDQKYCERHSHKSRPRSRKPVEVPPAHHNKNDHQTLKHSVNLASSKSQFVNQTMLSSMASSDEQPRCLEWFMKGQAMPVASNSNQEWHQKHLINSNSCINLGGGDFQAHQELVHDQYSLLLGTKLVSHQAPTQETRHFIDAWSIAEENSVNERLPVPLSSLALSMPGGGSEIIERNEDALMGSLGIMGSSEGENVGTLRPHWMNHDSGIGSPPGGPLAEALCLGIASSAKLDSNTASSPRGGCSTSTTTSSKSSCGDGGRGFNFTD
ncbi:hypothetical protein ACOSQ2_016928 [Xanthoceras sorbifolium]